MGEVSYKGHRYPAEIIAHCVWLYHRFPLSFREVEELLLVRGVIVSYETIRQWCAKFGPVYAAGLRRRQPRPGDKWHLDEVFVTITLGTYRGPLSHRRKNFLAATAFRRDCTKTSSTLPCWSIARHRYRCAPLIFTNTSSRCHLSPGPGRRRRNWLA